MTHPVSLCTGLGRFTWADGSWYEGEYDRGVRVRGTHVSADGCMTYTGRCAWGRQSWYGKLEEPEMKCEWI